MSRISLIPFYDWEGTAFSRWGSWRSLRQRQLLNVNYFLFIYPEMRRSGNFLFLLSLSVADTAQPSTTFSFLSQILWACLSQERKSFSGSGLLSFSCLSQERSVADSLKLVKGRILIYPEMRRFKEDFSSFLSQERKRSVAERGKSRQLLSPLFHYFLLSFSGA